MFQLFNGLEFLHSKRIIHRDIKTKNLVLNENDNLIICDFGFMTIIDEKSAKSILGSQGYTAPELLMEKPYKESVYVWAAGVVCLQLVNNLSENEIPSQIDLQNESKVQKLLADSPFKFIESCLIVDEKKRAKSSEILQLLREMKEKFE
jgi:serine/threonine protein kinase